MSYLAILMPDNQVFTEDKGFLTNNVLDFNSESNQGEHVTERSTLLNDSSVYVVRHFMPIIKDDQTIGMLYGVVELSRFSDMFLANVYDGKAQIYIVESESGNFLMDTWHKELLNVEVLLDRHAKEGYSSEKIVQDIRNGVEGNFVFTSTIAKEYFYMHYMPVKENDWMIVLSVPESVAFANARKVNSSTSFFLFVLFAIILLYLSTLILLWGRRMKEMKKMGTIDATTGLLNRNCYQDSLLVFDKEKNETVVCLFVDVNGLHEVNNTEGHEAGDMMLRRIADELKESFKGDKIYRMGGDEFLVISMNSSHLAIKDKLKVIKSELVKYNYHIAAGIAWGDSPVDIEGLVAEADAKMLREKRRYYDVNGNVRNIR